MFDTFSTGLYVILIQHFLSINFLHTFFFTYMACYRNKDPTHLTARGLRMPMYRERRPTNPIVPGVAARHDEVWGEQASKWKEYPFSVSNVTGKG